MLIWTGFELNSRGKASDGHQLDRLQSLRLTDRRALPLYVINALSAAGPNPEGCRSSTDPAEHCEDGINTNQYILQMRLGGLLSMPVPSAKEPGNLTRQALYDNSALERGSPEDRPQRRFLAKRIEHVIHIVKENRTYDQVLSDLEKGNGDPYLTLFPEPVRSIP
jgi:hypothetical protein